MKPLKCLCVPTGLHHWHLLPQSDGGRLHDAQCLCGDWHREGAQRWQAGTAGERQDWGVVWHSFGLWLFSNLFAPGAAFYLLSLLLYWCGLQYLSLECALFWCHDYSASFCSKGEFLSFLYWSGLEHLSLGYSHSFGIWLFSHHFFQGQVFVFCLCSCTDLVLNVRLLLNASLNK